MLKQLKKAIFIVTVFGLSACGFQFQHGQLIPKELQTLVFESADAYSEMAITMRNQLKLNNINLVEDQKDVPVLRITQVLSNTQVGSVFKQGREAEKLLMLEIQASVRFPNKDPHQISTKVQRTFFDNARAALAKSAEQEVVWRDMREQAARQLIAKMVSLQQQIQQK